LRGQTEEKVFNVTLTPDATGEVLLLIAPTFYQSWHRAGGESVSAVVLQH
jgi:hypothetical protein